MGIMLYQVNPDGFYDKVNFFPIQNEDDKKTNDMMNLILWENFGGDLNEFDKEYGISVNTNPLRKLPLLPANKVRRLLSGLKFKVYSDVDNAGINCRNSRKADICLAKYAFLVADELNGMNGCYTAVKHALLNAGIIDDYADMPKGSAKDSITYFEEHPEKFKKLDIKKEDLFSLPAGRIIVYTKEGKDGHIAITNGMGQEMSDCTDNMKWLEEHGNGANFTVYELTENWEYNPITKKLEFKENYIDKSS